MLSILRAPAILALLALPAPAVTLFVSPDGTGTDGLTWQSAFPTIGESIVSSSTGDEIWIRSATYFENVLIQKPLTLLGGFSGIETLEQRELRDPERLISAIDGTRNGTSVVTVDSTSATIEGLVVQNGLASEGSGMKISNALVILRNLAISRNGDLGNSISGGGIQIRNSTCELERCTVDSNASGSGGGLSLAFSNLSLINTTLADNTARQGGAIRVGGQSIVETRVCILTGNAAVYKAPVSGQIGSGGQGGAIYLNSAAGPITLKSSNSVFDRNTLSPIGGGSVFFAKGENTVAFEHCACIVGEDTVGFALFRNASLPRLVNSIVVGEPGEQSVPISAGEAFVEFSLIEGGYPGEGNITGDPKFVDIENGDYHLLRSSPCIDSGTDTGLITDFDGNPRPIGDYDMGAFEFPTFRGDIDGDGRVDEMDLLIFQRDWGKVSGN